MTKIIWAIEAMNSGEIYGVFSTKGKAIAAIKMWANSSHSYTIETDINMIPVLNRQSEAITIKYDINGETVTFWLKKFNLNNGAGIINAYRHNFGKDDENQE